MIRALNLKIFLSTLENYWTFNNMKLKIFTKIILITFILIFLSCFSSGCSEVLDNKENDVLLVEYFYFNVCSSCDPETEFLEEFEELTGISSLSPNLQIEMHNTYNEEENKLWENVVEEHKIPSQEQNFPILIIGNEIKNLSENTDYFSNSFINELPNNDVTILKNSSIIIYFSSPGCHNCIVVKEDILSRLPNEIIINKESSPVKLFEISISQKENAELFKKYCENYNVPENIQKTPIVFAGCDYLAGVAEISSLPDLLELGECQDTPIYEVANNNGRSLLSDYKLFSVFSTGLINGLNPCAISMILMLLSLLAVNKKLLLPVGISFAVGKFIGFLLLGTVLYSFVDILPYEKFALVTKVILLSFFSVMIVLNINDFIAAKKEKYQNIKLQLPQTFRKTNHNWIKKLVSYKKTGAIVIGGTILGLFISTGEFLCTGQIYLAVIIQAAHSTSSFSSKAFLFLTLYSIAFIIPVIVIVLLVYKGKTVFNLSEMFRKNMVWVKLINAILFIVFFILVLIIF